MGFPVLSLLIFLPLAGALWVLFAPGGEAARAANARVAALVVTLLEFALAVLIWVKFDNADPAFQFTEYHSFPVNLLASIPFLTNQAMVDLALLSERTWLY